LGIFGAASCRATGTGMYCVNSTGRSPTYPSSVRAPSCSARRTRAVRLGESNFSRSRLTTFSTYLRGLATIAVKAAVLEGRAVASGRGVPEGARSGVTSQCSRVRAGESGYSPEAHA
jgi:hypothetical protein